MRVILAKLTLIHSSLCDPDVDAIAGVYFPAIEGSRGGDGEWLDSDGVMTSTHEELRARKEADRFSVRRMRLSGEDMRAFRGIFTCNASTEPLAWNYEDTGMDTEMTFEVSLRGNTGELRSPLGDSGGELFVSNSVTGGLNDAEVTLVTREDGAIPFATMKHIGKK